MNWLDKKRRPQFPVTLTINGEAVTFLGVEPVMGLHYETESHGLWPIFPLPVQSPEPAQDAGLSSYKAKRKKRVRSFRLGGLAGRGCWVWGLPGSERLITKIA